MTSQAGTPPSEPGPAGGIRLRWEWRSFGQGFGVGEQRLARHEPVDTKESDETYLVSAGGDNVKVRDDLMDVKVLREVGADGLEQWAPVMKATFPLSAADATRVEDALRIAARGSIGEGCTFEQLLEIVARPEIGVRVVHVHKRRVRYSIDGCMAELSDVTANGVPIRTVAVESEDPAGVAQVIASLGLAGYANISYPRALAELLDGVPERYAVIDVGTNSIKFHIGARDPDGTWRPLVDRADMARLGEGLAHSGRIGLPALDRAAAAIADMAAEARDQGVRAIVAVGTAWMRSAANASDVVAAVRERTGIGIELVSGDEEARLAYLATTAALGPVAGPLAVFDTGGGSSQFTFGRDGAVDERFSVEVGAARYTERFGLDGAVSEEVLQQARSAIADDLARLDGRDPPQALVGMGGAVTNLAAVSKALAVYDPEAIQGTVLDAAEIDRQIALYRARDADARRTIVGLQPKRAEVILAGACIVRTVLDKLGRNSLVVSDRGLRHGLLAERFGS